MLFPCTSSFPTNRAITWVHPFVGRFEVAAFIIGCSRRVPAPEFAVWSVGYVANVRCNYKSNNVCLLYPLQEYWRTTLLPTGNAWENIQIISLEVDVIHRAVVAGRRSILGLSKILGKDCCSSSQYHQESLHPDWTQEYILYKSYIGSPLSNSWPMQKTLCTYYHLICTLICTQQLRHHTFLQSLSDVWCFKAWHQQRHIWQRHSQCIAVH